MRLAFAWAELFVERADDWCEQFVEQMGFVAIGYRQDSQMRSWALVNGGVQLIVSEAHSTASSVHRFLEQHSQGVADLAFWTDNLAFAPSGRLPGTVQLASPAGITHTFVHLQKSDLPPGFTPIPGALPATDLLAIDHVVLNLEAEHFEETIAWYQAKLGLRSGRYFEISTPRSGLKSWVLISADGRVRLPVNAPLTANSQVSEFLQANRGPGVQHIALATGDLAARVTQLSSRGVHFLSTPATYYEDLAARVELNGLNSAQLQQLGILVDRDETGDRLLQVFTEPLFAEPTLFFEFIERQGQATGFGEGNFQSLFEAIEREQRRRGSLAQ